MPGASKAAQAKPRAGTMELGTCSGTPTKRAPEHLSVTSSDSFHNPGAMSGASDQIPHPYGKTILEAVPSYVAELERLMQDTKEEV